MGAEGSMADLIGITTAAFQGVAALGTVAAAAGSLRAASQARDSVLLGEMTRHIDRLAAIADTVDALLAESGATTAHARQDLARELASVDDELPLCRQCASAPAEVVAADTGRALAAEIGTALRDARQARSRYVRGPARGGTHPHVREA
jgi:hypothetical protein